MLTDNRGPWTIEIKERCERCKGDREVPEQKVATGGGTMSTPGGLCPDCGGTGAKRTEWVTLRQLLDLFDDASSYPDGHPFVDDHTN